MADSLIQDLSALSLPVQGTDLLPFGRGTDALAKATVADLVIAQSQVTSLTSDLAAKEPTITAGTTAQYWRGDKSWQTLNATAVGLGSVTNNAQTQAAIVPNTAPSAGQILAGNAGGTAYAPVSVSGDATLASTGALTVTKTNGSNFAASATTDTTNASNISSGTLAAARGGAGTVNGILKANGSGTVSAASAGTDYVSPGGALGTPSSGTLTNCTGLPASSLTAGTLAANVTLGEDSGQIVLDAALSADGKYSGIIEAGTAGTTLAFGDLVYLAVADSRWELTDADAEATAGPVKLGVCVQAAAADGNSTTILLWGKVRADANFPTLTIGAPVYVSTTAGDVQVAKPSGTDDVVRVIGYANTADELFFCPSPDYVTLV